MYVNGASRSHSVEPRQALLLPIAARRRLHDAEAPRQQRRALYPGGAPRHTPGAMTSPDVRRSRSMYVRLFTSLCLRLLCLLWLLHATAGVARAQSISGDLVVSVLD